MAEILEINVKAKPLMRHSPYDWNALREVFEGQNMHSMAKYCEIKMKLEEQYMEQLKMYEAIPGD